MPPNPEQIIGVVEGAEKIASPEGLNLVDVAGGDKATGWIGRVKSALGIGRPIDAGALDDSAAVDKTSDRLDTETSSISAGERNLLDRGFQISSQVIGRSPGPIYDNFLVADTAEGSLASGMPAAARFGYPKDSHITLEGSRGAGGGRLHLGDGTMITSGFGRWKAELPDGTSMRTFRGNMLLGQYDAAGRLREYTVAEENQYRLPVDEADQALRNRSLDQFLSLQQRYPKIETWRFRS